MALRIRSYWHDEDTPRSSEELAGAIAFNGWKIAMHKAINLHGKDFVYDNDQQRLDVISEYLIFQTQIVDRMADKMMDDADRTELVTKMAIKMAGHIQDNSQELLGSGDYANRFITTLNQRSGEYAEFSLTKEGPSYPFYRHLGFEIQQIMGATHDNRWVIDQVMDMDGPEVYKVLKRTVYNLFD